MSTSKPRHRMLLFVPVLLAVGLAVGPATADAAVPVTTGGSVLPYPTGSGVDSTVGALSCALLTSCAAVGSYSTPSSNGPSLFVSSGGKFKPVDLASSGVTATFNAISCPAAGSCVAVGNADTGSTSFEPYALTQIGESWTGVALPVVDSGDNGTLLGVSCPAPGSCVAVGSETTTAGTVPLADSLNDGGWTPTELTNFPYGGNGELDAISCPAVGSCQAFADSSGENLYAWWAATFSGGAWTTHAIQGQGGFNGSGRATGISCPTMTWCLAVGDDAFSYETQTWGGPYSATLQNGAWGVPYSLPVDQYVSGVSCPVVGGCLATMRGGVVLGLGNGVWGSTEVQNPSPSGSNPVMLGGVSCAAGGVYQSCVIGGGATVSGSKSTYPLFGTVDLPTQGYFTPTASGGVYTYGTAVYRGSMAGQPLAAPVVGMALTPGGNGYWLAASDGGIFTFGLAYFWGSAGGLPLNDPVVGITALPDGDGYWEVASDGGIFAFGYAHYYGSTGAMALNQPVVGMATTPDGLGYWLVAKDGGIFAFGDAKYYGSTGAMTLNQPIVGMAATPDGNGYWLVGADGGVFSFGDAHFFGSAADQYLASPVVGMAATPSGLGYRLVESGGGVFTYGDAEFWGSQAGAPIPSPVVGVAS